MPDAEISTLELVLREQLTGRAEAANLSHYGAVDVPHAQKSSPCWYRPKEWCRQFWHIVQYFRQICRFFPVSGTLVLP